MTAGLHQGSPQLLAVLPVQGDDRTVVVAPHQEVVQARVCQDTTKEQQVLHHGLVRRPVVVDQGVPALVPYDVGPVLQARNSRWRCYFRGRAGFL